MKLIELFPEQESPQYRMLVKGLPAIRSFNQLQIKEVPARATINKKETVLQFGSIIVRHVLSYDKLNGYLIFNTYEGRFMANMLTGDTIRLGTNMDLLDMIIKDTVSTDTEFADITANRCIATKIINLSNKKYYIGAYSLVDKFQAETALGIPLKLKPNTLVRMIDKSTDIRGRVMVSTKNYTFVRSLPELNLIAINNFTMKQIPIADELVNVREVKDGLFHTVIKYQTAQNSTKVYKLPRCSK